MVKKVLILMLLAGILTPVSAQRKKVAVVLSGGGAKGVAHIGALKVIEEAGIPIDMVVGTSMGAIVGGLYSIGYSPAQMDSLIGIQDWKFLFSDKVKRTEQTFMEKESSEKYLVSLPFHRKPKETFEGGLISAQNLTNLFSELTIGYHDSISFNSLPIPYACVAVDVITGEEVVFHSGVLATAMRASMAIPAVFTPVRIADKVLVDGGLLDNYPVDVARKMGAEIIIGVDLKKNEKEPEEVTGAADIIGRILDFISRDQYQKNVEDSDVHINVDVTGYSASSFGKADIDTLKVRGEVAARQEWANLIAVKEKIGVPPDYIPAERPEYRIYQPEDRLEISEITFTGLEAKDSKWVLRKCRLKPGSEISIAEIEYAASVLTGSEAYSGVRYTLLKVPDGYNLHFDLDKKRENTLRFGLRFDSEEIAAAIVNTTLNFATRMPSEVAVTGRLGKRSMARLDYSIEPWFMKHLNLSYMFQYNDYNVYDHGHRAYNTTYKYHFAEAGFVDYIGQRAKLMGGLRFEHYDYDNFLYSGTDIISAPKPKGYVSYFVNWQYDTYDKRNFPSVGQSHRLGASLYTDNFATFKGGAPFAEIHGDWNYVYALTNRFAFIPSLYGRVLIGREIPYSYQNVMGGDVYGRYMPQQLPFAGINYLELFRKSVVVAQLKMRQRFWENSYVALTGNYGLSNTDFFKLFSGFPVYGGSIGYGYNSLFGPLEVSLNYSNRTEKIGFYLNLGFIF